MKNKLAIYSILLAFSCLTLVLLSFTSKNKVYTPPGTIHLEYNLFIDHYFVSNIDYREFEFFIKDYLHKLEVDSIPSYYSFAELNYINEDFVSRMHIDSAFKRPLSYQEPIIEVYYWHPAFDHYPVMNVNLEQAKAYCKWRSDVVNIMNELKVNKKRTTETRHLKYFIPSKEELIEIEKRFPAFVIEPIYSMQIFSSLIFSKKYYRDKVIFLENSLSDLCEDGSLFGSNWFGENDNQDNYSISSFRCMCEVVIL